MNIRIFSTCPQSAGFTDGRTYIKRLIEVAQWSDAYGCEGILVYTDNRLVDPWLVSDIILQNTQKLCPLVAVQPIYMHPYSAAKIAASYGYLYGRRIYLNMVAGGFGNDLASLNDTTPHDRRYDRLVEYTLILKSLLGNEPVTFAGEFYQVNGLKLRPQLPDSLFPGILMSGSSEAGIAAARAAGAIAVKYPKPPNEEQPPKDAALEAGVRVGIIARQSEDEAWDVAERRFPEDRKGQIAHQLAMKTSDSSWHKQLSEIAESTTDGRNPYWLFPFQNYQTFCPYLVGSYERVGGELARYLEVGYETFILDIPAEEEELKHIVCAFDSAQKVRLKELIA